MIDYLKELDKLNWEFEMDDTRYLTHSYHPYSSKYIPQIPRNLIEIFSKKKELILDNFLGSGTTLVECKLSGRNGIGVDVNPLACLISKVKTTNLVVDALLKKKRGQIEEIKKEIDETKKTINPDFLPDFNIVKWFQPQIIEELLIIKKSIEQIKEQSVRDFFKVAFSSIIRTTSNATSGFGNLMINKKPPQKNNVLGKYVTKIDTMIEEMKSFNKLCDRSVNIKIFNENAKALYFIPDNSIDMICTHPPYMASVPYAEYQKLSLWWLGYDPRKLDKELTGGQRSRKNMTERYLEDMERSFLEMHRVLKDKKFCCIVIGNPLYQGKIWPLNKIFIDMGKEAGFDLIREITRGKYRTTMGKMKQEYILIFKK